MMKPWSYYSTPVLHPWVGDAEISKFREEHRIGPGASYEIARWVWYQDDLTRSELRSLRAEFEADLCQELRITSEEYRGLDPIDTIIGSPPEEVFPGASEYKEIYEYIKEKTRPLA